MSARVRPPLAHSQLSSTLVYVRVRACRYRLFCSYSRSRALARDGSTATMMMLRFCVHTRPRDGACVSVGEFVCACALLYAQRQSSGYSSRSACACSLLRSVRVCTCSCVCACACVRHLHDFIVPRDRLV